APKRAEGASEQSERAAGVRGRQAAQRLEQREDVVVVDRLEEAEQPEGGLIRDTAEEPETSLQRARLDLGHEAHRSIEQAHEHEERREPVAQVDELRV